MMKIEKRSQLEHEQKAWQRSLEFFRQENALLKYRLSEMVDDNEESGFLQMAEYFQNQLLIKDEILNNLIKDIHQFSLKFQEFQNAKLPPERMVRKHHNFRINILQFEKEFLTLSQDFNVRLLHNI